MENNTETMRDEVNRKEPNRNKDRKLKIGAV